MDTLDRIEIMQSLREGIIDVVVGVNLLREGLDLPEVSLVAILDADKEGFLRSEKSLTQTAGRAARNINSKVIMYADTITGSMQRTIDETNRRRAKQKAYNKENNITPRQIVKSTREALAGFKSKEKNRETRSYSYENEGQINLAADPLIPYMNEKQLKEAIRKTRKSMEAAAKELDFIEAARLRDEMFGLEKLLKEKKED